MRYQTSPYLLWHRDANGVESWRTIDGCGVIPANEQTTALLGMFIAGSTGVPAGYGELYERAVELGFLVSNMKEHQKQVFTAFERRFDPDRPRIGYIETTSQCPFTCVMCPKSQAAWVRPNKVMDRDLFARIVAQLKFQEVVVLHLFGDPLLDPHIVERISVVRSAELRAVFSTNAMLLKPALVDRLLSTDLSKLIISFDATSEATYQEIRGVQARMAVALPRVEGFLRRWKQRRSALEVVLRFVNLDANLPERDQFVTHWSSWEGVEVDVKNHLRFPDVPALLDERARLARGPWRFHRHALGLRAPTKCTRHWMSPQGELAVQVDGRVVPCCLSHSDEVVLGDLQRSSLASIWRGKRFAELRRSLFFRENLEAFPLCNRCNYDMP